MKKILITLIAGLCFSQADAQYWQYPNINANQNPGNLNATEVEQPFGSNPGWDSIQAPSGLAVWSPTKTLPFAFNFNGAPVTQFKVSTTGVLTFDVGTALAAPSNVVSILPNAAIPNKSICVWGIQGTGTNDKIITKVFGTAPNRQFWVSFNSYSYYTNANIFSYWSIVLDETTNNIHIVDQRTGAGSGSAIVAISAGLQFTASTGMPVALSPALGALTTANSDLPDDNTYYSFIPGTQPANDIATTGASASGYFVAPGNQNVSITVKNIGSAAISTYTINYKDGANPTVSQTVSSSIASFASNTTTFTTPLAVTLGAHPLKIWATLTNDNLHANDSSNKTIMTGVTSFPRRSVTMEEPTGTWCGWCVRGTVYMDSIAKAHPNDVIPISVHNADPMVVAAYDAGVGPLIGGYPSLLVDRKEEADPSDVFTQYTKHIGDFGFADVNATHTIVGNVLTVNASIVPATDMNGDFRLAMVPIEDRVHGTASGYNQTNYYAVGGSGNATPMKNLEYHFNVLPNPVPNTTMYYDFVARDIVGGFDGQAGSLPNAMITGTTYNKTFNYTIPTTYDIVKMKYAVLLMDKNGATSKILNGSMSTIYPLGFSDIIKSNIISATAYPNPATNQLSIDFTTTESVNASYSILDITGKLIVTKDLGNLSTGANTIEIEVADFLPGIYSIVINTNKGTYQSKFSKQ
jgi:Secretion system C-terminal sorting domain